jgi:UDP-N-acetylmuramoyl-tripeptide--D-alanyl-D-alanine ligase
MKWRIDTIIRATGGRPLGADNGQPFSGVAIDSRAIAPDRLFVAIVGERHDGHAFVEQVTEKGVRGLVVAETSDIAKDAARWQSRGIAVVAVSDTTRALGRLAAFQRARADIPVVAITGSNGKTSTRQMTTLVMAQEFNTLATQGNLNNEIGLPLTLFGLNEQHQAAVLELGMNHPGEIDRLGAICRPTIGVITNVAAAHLEFLESLEGVAQAKGELIPHIDDKGALILNQDDPFLVELAGKARCKVIFFGLTSDADVYARNIEETGDGLAFEVILPVGRITVRLRTPGRFMVANALAAAAVGYKAGLSADRIQRGLEAFHADKGRLKIRHTRDGIHIVDDTYNANPESVAAALRTLSSLKGDQTAHAALGDMLELGRRSATLHAEMGRQAVRSGVDKLFLYGDFAESTAQGARNGGMASDDIFIGSKQAIAEQVGRQLQPGHWLLVKGSRAMAMEDIVKTIMEKEEKRQPGTETR